jgi:hypothetical protein
MGKNRKAKKKLKSQLVRNVYKSRLPQKADHSGDSIWPNMSNQQWSLLKELNAQHNGDSLGLRKALIALGHHKCVEIWDQYNCLTVMTPLEKTWRMSVDEFALRRGLESKLQAQ